MSRCRSCGTPISGEFIRCEPCRDQQYVDAPWPPPLKRRRVPDDLVVEVLAWVMFLGGLVFCVWLILWLS